MAKLRKVSFTEYMINAIVSIFDIAEKNIEIKNSIEFEFGKERYLYLREPFDAALNAYYTDFFANVAVISLDDEIAYGAYSILSKIINDIFVINSKDDTCKNTIGHEYACTNEIIFRALREHFVNLVGISDWVSVT